MTRTALNVMRDELLRDALGDCLSLSHVDGIAARTCPNDTLSKQQELVLRVIESLLTDELVVAGDIVGASDERVEPWPLSVDEIVARIRERYVDHHDDRNWVFSTWFALTETGEDTARELQT